MLSKAKEQLVRSLHRKKDREESGLCLVEGNKVIETAGDAVEWTFSRNDSDAFDALVTTDTPQDVVGVARIPRWTREDVSSRSTIVVLDGVQDPGNVGAILRLCLGFDASLVLIESADVTSSKVVRASAGAMFQVPWMAVPRKDAVEFILGFDRPVNRLESSMHAVILPEQRPAVSLSNGRRANAESRILIAGSEGSGIQLDIAGESISILHNPKLESLNVGHALAIVLSQGYERQVSDSQ